MHDDEVKTSNSLQEMNEKIEKMERLLEATKIVQEHQFRMAGKRDKEQSTLKTEMAGIKLELAVVGRKMNV